MVESNQEALVASLDTCFANLVHVIVVIGKLTQHSNEILQGIYKRFLGSRDMIDNKCFIFFHLDDACFRVRFLWVFLWMESAQSVIGK